MVVAVLVKNIMLDPDLEKTDSCPQSERNQNPFLVKSCLNYAYIGFKLSRIVPKDSSLMTCSCLISIFLREKLIGKLFQNGAPKIP